MADIVLVGVEWLFDASVVIGIWQVKICRLTCCDRDGSLMDKWTKLACAKRGDEDEWPEQCSRVKWKSL